MADKKLHVLYIPGLGDNSVTGQTLAVRTWRLWGVRGEVVQMRWNDTEPWETKLKRLLGRIDALTEQGKKVGLVGASAGASAAINAYAQRKSQLAGCILIAGKVNNPDAIGMAYRQKTPSFVLSAYECQKALGTLGQSDRKSIMSRYSIHDGVVNSQDSYVEGACNQTVLTIGHAFTIGSQLIFGAPNFLSFLKAAKK